MATIRLDNRRLREPAAGPIAVETDYFEGRHRISGRRAYDFLWEKLCS